MTLIGRGAALSGRGTDLRTTSRAACDWSSEVRSRSDVEVARARLRRLNSIDRLRASRRRFFDRHGPVVAMLDEERPKARPPDTDPSLEARMIEFLSSVGVRLHEIGLVLARAESELGQGDGPAREHVAYAVQQVDRTIRDLHTTAFRIVFGEEPPRGVL